MTIHWIDLTIFIIYLCAMLGVGFYYMRKNKSKDDYYVGGRNMSATHIGLSVVATDVGGGFSIGLGGLGFVMGISGSWMLFTGLLGAWLSAVLLIPRVYKTARDKGFLTFPEMLAHRYNGRVAFVAGVISLIGYIGFTSSQILAGAKLASATFPEVSIMNAILIMGIVAVLYTVVGGMKAVIYTDTIQWIILMSGIIFIGIPIAYVKIGGMAAIQEYASADMLSMTNLSLVKFFNWLITIVPIWFVGMTLYQRIYACRDEKTARRAWRIAGLFEWPVMAFMGVLLGLFARIGFEQGMFTAAGYAPGNPPDAELGLPMLLNHVLPIGLLGLMMSAYFSAIMSTADSCLMAASGNFTTDLMHPFRHRVKLHDIKASQITTLVIGTLAIILATSMQDVLELMLYSYAFMVSGLIVPVAGMLLLPKPSATAALSAMITGGSITLALIIWRIALPGGLDPIFFGTTASAICFIFIQYISPNKNGVHHT